MYSSASKLRSGALAGLILAACGQEPPRPTSALIITLDTTRADALSCQGAPPGVTPHLDALAARATRYTQARTVAPLTLPAHASMLTGLYPPRHGLRDNAISPLPASAYTLAEAAAAGGLETAAFVAAAVLDPAWGLAQGFDHYGSVSVGAGTDGAGVHMAERPAQEVVRDAVAWMEGRTRPFLLWVHLFDPHAPYEPPPGFEDQDSPYLGEVAATDHALGILLAALARTGRAADTLVVVAADHGEDLGQHGEPTHSVLTYDTTIRIPLIILDPGQGPDGGDGDGGDGGGDGSGGAVEEGPVSIVDIYPTVLEALDLPPSKDGLAVDGVSLFRRPPPAGRGVYFESYAGYLGYGWAPLSGWANAAGQYLHGPTAEFFVSRRGGAGPAAGGAIARQKRNRLGEQGAEAARARAAIEEVASGPALEPDPVDDLAAGASADPELIAAVRGLGYLGAGAGADEAASLPHPLAETGRADPRARLEQLAAFYDAALLAGTGQRPRAIELLTDLVRASPTQTHAAAILAQFLQAEGRAQEALPILRRALANGIERPSLHQRLALCLEACGDLQTARVHLERAAALRPGDARTEAGLARLVAAINSGPTAAPPTPTPPAPESSGKQPAGSGGEAP